MPFTHFTENDFLKQTREVIDANLSDEHFGVSELAKEMNMSRSNLLRKVKKSANLSVSQYIRQVRLERAMIMLQETSSTVSEISFKVGFNSTSYFIKCFREYYGYPPGQVGKGVSGEGDYNQLIPPGDPHQLVAIMFTDIEGYTALMQHDEKKALTSINRHREVFNSITSKYKGRILQYYGDGTLSTFNSAIDAVKCGVDMQLMYREAPRIPVRIGIHSGDVIISDNGIIGDGVNVASRIESLAVPYSVFISEKVYDEVKNQPSIRTISLGEFELKNVDRPMEVFAITNPGLAVPKRDQISGKIKTKESDDGGILSRTLRSRMIRWFLIILAMTSVGYLIHKTGIISKYNEMTSSSGLASPEKSIAVLPFINDSNDSSNVYIINGLMEAILNNLQKIEDLRVVSRTSVEKYRNTQKNIPEIARELNVNYFVEGSGQKIGDQILLNIQLINASTDKHLWGGRYDREARDIFTLQIEVARDIADQIEAIILPEEDELINKIPTSHPLAYDNFLKGQELMFQGTRGTLQAAIPFLKKAIDQDDKFAHAYADLAIVYYFLDALQADKKYIDSINTYSDQAMLFDPKLPQSLVSKALFYLNNGEHELALPYLETALEYHPNSAMVLNVLSDYYANYRPNTQKYLEYALRGIRLNIGSQDSTTASFTYLHISNALIQSGFVEEAEMYINKSLQYDPGNLFSEYLKAYVLYAKDRSLEQTKEHLLTTLRKDSTRVDIIQETGKIYYYLRDYENAFAYYSRLGDIVAFRNLDIFRSEKAKIGLVYAKMGRLEEAEEYFADYKDYADNDQSIYKHLSLAVYHSYMGNREEAIKQMRLFSEQDNYHLWMTLFLEIDPLLDNIIELPETQEILIDIQDKFWKNHEKVKISLKEKGLIE